MSATTQPEGSPKSTSPLIKIKNHFAKLSSIAACGVLVRFPKSFRGITDVIF
jgi:hypothetical protein